jgi:hypothetical protein
MRYLLLISLLLSGCAAPVLIMTGVGATSVGVNESTGKTVSDHIVSGINGKDCRISRSFDGKDMCQDEVQPVNVTVTESKYRPSTTADIEARYK